MIYTIVVALIFVGFLVAPAVLANHSVFDEEDEMGSGEHSIASNAHHHAAAAAKSPTSGKQ
jgi:hypothetical protein